VTSTLDEAEMYANNGFDDILYGYPLIPFHLLRCYDLRAKLQQFHVMVNNCDIVMTLNKTEPPPGKRWSAFIKVDAGNDRGELYQAEFTSSELDGTGILSLSCIWKLHSNPGQ
jgi:D-serine deaminase-like pyridoxal phosphate-dependent protein